MEDFMIFDSDTHISPYKYLDIALTKRSSG